MTSDTPGLIPITSILQERGTLVAAEAFTQVPFAIARVFVVADVPHGERRGEHAHRRCEQFLVCVRGSLDAVADTGASRQIFHLDSPAHGLYLPPLTWGGQLNHSPDAILLVLASEPFDADDYIHDYESFLEVVTGNEVSA